MAQGDRPHTSFAGECWCNPVVLKVCPECEDEWDGDGFCWKCGGEGLVVCEEYEQEEQNGLVFVHRTTDGAQPTPEVLKEARKHLA